MTTSTELPREAYTLLAQANLLRMRGRWPEAIETCMEAMRLAPDSATAQSLLGDIYENQGCIDDAMQWYQMALDVNPDSAADALKLARLRDAKRRAPSDDETAAPVTGGLPPPASVKIATAQNPDRLLRAGAIFAGLAMLLILLAALVLHGRLGARAARPIATAPVYVAPQQSFADTDDGTPRDPSEQAIVTSLHDAPELSGADVSVTDAQIDPRTNRLTLTLLYTPSATAPITRDGAVRAALRVLQAAGRLPEAQGISAFTVRCLSASSLGTPVGSAPLLMTADAARAAMPSDAAALTPAQAQSLLLNVWWASSVPQ